MPRYLHHNSHYPQRHRDKDRLLHRTVPEFFKGCNELTGRAQAGRHRISAESKKPMTHGSKKQGIANAIPCPFILRPGFQVIILTSSVWSASKSESGCGKKYMHRIQQRKGESTQAPCARWVRGYRRKYYLSNYNEEKGMAQQPSKSALELKYYVKELEKAMKEKLENRQTGTFISGEKG